MLTYYTATSDLPCGIKTGDTVSLNRQNPAEPVLVHRPVSEVCAAKIAAWVEAGILAPVSPSGDVPVGPSPAPVGRPRLRLLRADGQQTA